MVLLRILGVVLSSFCFSTLASPLARQGHLERRAAPYFFKGHDLSSLLMLEEGGAIYHDSARGNVTRPAEDILGDGGMNTIRLRQGL